MNKEILPLCIKTSVKQEVINYCLKVPKHSDQLKKVKYKWKNVVGASVTTPPTQPARPKKHAGELISSPQLISDSCTQLNLPTRTRQDQQSGQKLS